MAKAGIIGGGMIAAVHAAAVRASGHEVVGVASRSEASANRAAATLGVRAFADPETLIDDRQVDVIHVCSPNSSHVGYALRAIAAGKAVVCEKPLGVDLGEALLLRDAARRVNARTAVPFVYRFYSVVREMRSRVMHDQVLLIRATYLQDWLADPRSNNWRVNDVEGGASRAFADIGVHLCDLIEFISGERITRLTARTFRAYAQREASPVSTEDGATLLFETETGAPGTATISQVSQGNKNRLELAIDTGGASYGFNQEEPDKLLVGQSSQNAVVSRSAQAFGAADAIRLSRLPPGHPQGYQDAFTAFMADAYGTFEGRPDASVPTFDDGYRAAALTHAVLSSHVSQRWEPVHPEVANTHVGEAGDDEDSMKTV